MSILYVNWKATVKFVYQHNKRYITRFCDKVPNRYIKQLQGFQLLGDTGQIQTCKMNSSAAKLTFLLMTDPKHCKSSPCGNMHVKQVRVTLHISISLWLMHDKNSRKERTVINKSWLGNWMPHVWTWKASMPGCFEKYKWGLFKSMWEWKGDQCHGNRMLNALCPFWSYWNHNGTTMVGRAMVHPLVSTLLFGGCFCRWLWDWQASGTDEGRSNWAL